MDTLELLKLTEKISNGTASDEEVRLYNAFYNSFQKEIQHWDDELLGKQTDIDKELSGRIQKAIKKPFNIHRRLWPRIAAAASIILALSIGGYFLLHKQPQQQTAQNLTQDIRPGSNKLILKLANGKTVVVTDAKNGLLAQQGNTSISKNAGGLLVYKGAGNDNSAMLYDTLIVPRGGQHQVRFADGSIAYINAETKLRIPESFAGKDRTVEVISGNAIFKVAYNANVPFYVKHQGQITQDLGTEFDVNAYPEEQGVKTTLIEGSIKVSANGQTILLKPGQQSLVQAGLALIKIKSVDVEEVTAWKDGYFDLNDANLESIMRQVSRWYDVDVTYSDNSLKTQVFSGTISRFKNVSQLIEKLELTGAVHFKIEGKKIFVSK
jgi:transmembrane sensor